MAAGQHQGQCPRVIVGPSRCQTLLLCARARGGSARKHAVPMRVIAAVVLAHEAGPHRDRVPYHAEHCVAVSPDVPVDGACALWRSSSPSGLGGGSRCDDLSSFTIGRSCGRGGVDELQCLQPNNDVVHEHAEEERTGEPFAIAATSPHQWTLENVLESSDGCSELTWSLAQRSRRVDNVARQ